MNEKFIFGIVAIIIFAVIQIGAFVMGFNGQVLTITTNAIVAIVSYLLGVDITQKKVISQQSTESHTLQDIRSK